MALDLAKNTLSEGGLTELLNSVHAEEVYRKDFTDEDNNPSFWKYIAATMNNGVTDSSRLR